MLWVSRGMFGMSCNGSAVICFGKSGALTLNQMSARMIFFLGRRFTISGEGYQPAGMIRAELSGTSMPDLRPLLTPLAVCNDSHVHGGKPVGDPMEAALLVLAQKGGLAREVVQACLPRVAEIPFDAAYKYMATFHAEGQRIQVFVKGAPDVLLAQCSHVLAAGGEVRLDDAWRRAIEAEYKAWAEQGLHGLLVAVRSVQAATFQRSRKLFDYVSDLTFIGLVGLTDPPRPQAKEAIALCRSAGIMVKMITGDHRDTAAAIARQLGMHGKAVTGAELDGMHAARLVLAIDDIAVFARVAPHHRPMIARALKARGHVVAMTSDGCSHAPPAGDHVDAIVEAVWQARAFYDNILKFIRFQLSAATGLLLIVLLAPVMALSDPFDAVQVLWIALIVNGPLAVSLALDCARPGIMHEPPRRQSLLLPARLGKILALGMVMAAGTLAMLSYGMHGGSEARALTLAFTVFVLFQVFNVFNARTENDSSFNRHSFNNPMLWRALAGVTGLQIIVVQWPAAQAVFHTVALSPGDWLLALAAAASVLLLDEARKFLLVLLHRIHPWRRPP